MTKIRVYMFLLTLVFSLSCKDSKEQMSDNTMDEKLNIDCANRKKIEEIRRYLLVEQKISTLNVLWYAYEEANQKSLILSDAIFMANAKKDPYACHLIFEGYFYLYFPNIEYFDNINKGEYFFKLPVKERELIINYLEIGAEQKFFKCVDDLIQIYEFEKNPKAEYYKRIKDLKYIEDFYEK